MKRWILVLLVGGLLAAPVHAQHKSWQIEVVVDGAEFPVALAFAPDGTLFYTEKETGRVRLVTSDGGLQREPVITLPTDPFVERGLLGIAVDPRYTENGYVWVYHTQPNSIEPPYPINKVVRFEVQEGIGQNPVSMLSVPVTTRVGHHMGGNLHFGDDGMLYVSIGDYGEASFAQDLKAMQGRIHRFAVEGDALVPAPDNPFKDNSTYAYGLRNPFDFDFDPFTGDLFATENGPTCDDEVNLIFPGGNYGWRPDYPCDDNNPQEGARFVYPVVHYTPPQALTGIIVYDGEMFPQWEGNVFYCGWNFGILRRAELDETRSMFEKVEEMDLGDLICSTDIEVAPNGAIYFIGGNAIYRITTN